MTCFALISVPNKSKVDRKISTVLLPAIGHYLVTANIKLSVSALVISKVLEKYILQSYIGRKGGESAPKHSDYSSEAEKINGGQ